ncbi:MAG: peptide-methionine (S)-S-oxide reductase MsrA [Bacteroidia bacterium]
MSNIQLATVGGGCFWCVEAVLLELKGVQKVVSGYSGGSIKNPTYREICSGLTGHAEVVQVSFDADVISYEDLLTVFMTTHDPTTLNRQGADKGTQYRSVIYYHDEAQKAAAERVIANLGSYFNDPMVTEVSPLDIFYDAEDYHQNYYANNPAQPYCSVVISPKVSKLRAMYADRLRVS